MADSAEPVTGSHTTATAADEAGTALAIDGEGIRLVNRTTGSTRAVHFGSEAQTAIDAVTAARGAPESRSSNDECGAGPTEFVVWDGGFSLLVRNGEFEAWSLSDRAPPAYRTMSGVGIGTPRNELEAAYKVDVFQSTLGTEFNAGDIFGVLDSDKAHARIVALWAGAACVFR